MGIKNKIIKNASWIIVCKIIQAIISFFIGMFTARYLGPPNYGLINYAASITAFLIPVMQLGMRSIMVNELIHHPKREGAVLGTGIVMCIGSALLSVFGIFAFTMIADRGEPVTITVCVLYSGSLIFQAVELIELWFQAKLLSKYSSVAALGAYAVVSLLRIYLLVTKQSVQWFAFSYLLDYLLIALILVFFYRRNHGQRFAFSFSLGKDMLSRSKYYIVSTMMVAIFAQTDKIMIKQMLDEAQTGYYSAAITLITATGFVYNAIIDSMRPSILEAKKNQSPDFEDKMCLLYSVITYISLAQCLAMTLLAKPIILIIYGEEYLHSVSVLRIATWYVTFSYYGMVRNVWILAEQKQRYLWIINLSGALMNIVLNFILIPYIGIIGAAVASLVTQIFTNVFINYIIKPIRYNNRLMLKGLNPRLLLTILKKEKGQSEA